MNDAMHKEVSITRIFDAPRTVVFKAWTEAKQVAKWWGPKDFSNPVCQMDMRVGGSILIHMKGPDGTEHPMTGVFKEIVTDEKLVFTCDATDKDGKLLLEALTTVLFSDFNGKTKMVLNAKAKGIAPEAEQMLAGMNEGWSQSIERLTDLVDNTNGAVIVERSFNAPVSKVWKALSDKDEMKKWYFDLPEFKAEVGFEFTFTGGNPDSIQYLHKCTVTEAVKEQKLSYTWRYDGYEGNSIVTFELFNEGEDPEGKSGKTRLKITHRGLETFPAIADFARGNFVEGWNHICNISLKEYLEGK